MMGITIPMSAHRGIFNLFFITILCYHYTLVLEVCQPLYDEILDEFAIPLFGQGLYSDPNELRCTVSNGFSNCSLYSYSTTSSKITMLSFASSNVEKVVASDSAT